MECTALVVYEDWQTWETRWKLRMVFTKVGMEGFKLSDEYLDNVISWCNRTSIAVTEAINRMLDVFRELSEKLSAATTIMITKVDEAFRDLRRTIQDFMAMASQSTKKMTLSKCCKHVVNKERVTKSVIKRYYYRDVRHDNVWFTRYRLRC